MAIDNPDVIDIISVDPSGRVVLCISDHLYWIDSVAHQCLLQVKINRYLAFVESGEILDRYPNARGRQVVIEVVTQHEPDAEGLLFLDRAKNTIALAGFEFVWRQFQPVRIN
jgi:hypothetical protein